MVVAPQSQHPLCHPHDPDILIVHVQPLAWSHGVHWFLVGVEPKGHRILSTPCILVVMMQQLLPSGQTGLCDSHVSRHTMHPTEHWQHPAITGCLIACLHMTHSKARLTSSSNIDCFSRCCKCCLMSSRTVLTSYSNFCFFAALGLAGGEPICLHCLLDLFQDL